ALMIIAATPIALILAFGMTLLPEAIGEQLRSIRTVTITTIFFALLLWWADMKGGNHRAESDMKLADAVFIGATQAIAAILPGTSRSGITMTAARGLGFSRIEAARFSMLIGAPLLAAGGAYAILELVSAAPGSITLGVAEAALIVFLSFASALVSIWGLMAVLKRMSFLPFVVYRILLGVALIAANPIAFGLVTA
ncbi:MAG: undecaprenyl-diphosphate phosphatase, partial [Pseudomonadota bacterium]